MESKMNVFLLSIILYSLHTEAFVLYDREPIKSPNDQRSANKLAEALKAIDTQRRKRAQSSVFENEENPSVSNFEDLLQDEKFSDLWRNRFSDESYMKSDLGGYDWDLPQQTDDNDYYAYYSDYLDGNDLYQDQYPYDTEDLSPQPDLTEPSKEELSDIMNDEEEETEQESSENALDSNAATSEELKNIFQDESEEADREKKTANWAPKVLGLAGNKRSDGAQAIEEKDGQLRQLSDKEVEELLKSAKDAEVKSLDKHIEMTNVNGKETLSAKEIEDILTDEDGDGNTEEIIVEHDIPVEQAQAEVSDNMKEVNDNMEQTEAEMQQDLEAAEAEMNANIADMASLTREVLGQYPDDDDDFTIKKKRSDSAEDQMDTNDLAKQCLMRYILLEDAENTDLSEALDWATRAQYEGNDNYIPVQVDYLRKAVMREQLLQQLQEECLQLLGVDLEQTDENEVGQDLPDSDTMLDLGRPKKRGGEFIPEFLEDYPDEAEAEEDDAALEELLKTAEEEEEEKEKEELEAEENRILLNALEDAYEEYLIDQLKTYIAKQKQRNALAYLPRDMNDVTSDDDTWYEQPIKDEDIDEQDELPLNPFLRELMERYDTSSLGGPLQGDGYGNNADLLPLEDLYESTYLDDGSCPAVDDMIDNCAYALALGWTLDDEAMMLCNRHQLCYACGEAHDITAEQCDIGYQQEAYSACAGEEAEVLCIDEADTLYDLMSRVHKPVYTTRLECAAPCVEDFITGDYFKK